jgi:hypothetical protein
VEEIMKRMIPVILAAFILVSALPACAQVPGSSVGLGLSAGAALPLSAGTGVFASGGVPSFNWGFYVNIPLIYTFHLTPSSELYNFGSQNATDFDIAFKFIVPLSTFSLYAGFSPGLTAVSDALVAHVGGLAGGTFKLVSNLDVFLQGKYVLILTGGQNLSALHVNAGILFGF